MNEELAEDLSDETRPITSGKKLYLYYRGPPCLNFAVYVDSVWSCMLPRPPDSMGSWSN